MFQELHTVLVVLWSRFQTGARVFRLLHLMEPENVAPNGCRCHQVFQNLFCTTSPSPVAFFAVFWVSSFDLTFLRCVRYLPLHVPYISSTESYRISLVLCTLCISMLLFPTCGLESLPWLDLSIPLSST